MNIYILTISQEIPKQGTRTAKRYICAPSIQVVIVEYPHATSIELFQENIKVLYLGG